MTYGRFQYLIAILHYLCHVNHLYFLNCLCFFVLFVFPNKGLNSCENTDIRELGKKKIEGLDLKKKERKKIKLKNSEQSVKEKWNT